MAPTLSLGIYSFFKGNKPKSQSFKKKSLFFSRSHFRRGLSYFGTFKMDESEGEDLSV